jgi:hypothetical protein
MESNISSLPLSLVSSAIKPKPAFKSNYSDANVTPQKKDAITSIKFPVMASLPPNAVILESDQENCEIGCLTMQLKKQSPNKVVIVANKNNNNGYVKKSQVTSTKKPPANNTSC